MAFYLGRRSADDLILFRSSKIPTRETHGTQFTSVIGPFKSSLAAGWYARYGRNDLRVHSADEIEQLARADPRMQQAIVEEKMTKEELSIALECSAMDSIEYSPDPLPTLQTVWQIQTKEEQNAQLV
ncbi:hypothetical protein [Candidatus Villigracilis saccharophilus]|uniref:hypothetical protein n=1 Tax=Candidatus Villigracilis saccharophilus TaxID=3140684 RepID=UPI00313644FC|nr:hypothetical protein [Anaerolineales bacterium]